MLTQNQKIGLKLWLQITLLAMVMPLAGAFSGWYYAALVTESSHVLFATFIGLCIGITIDIVCYYEKLFSLVFYQIPIPVILFLIFFEIALFFVNKWQAALIALIGLALGILIVKVLIVPNPFYTMRKRIVIVIYILLSIIMLGVMMGVPVSNFLLGIIAGNYFSIRYAGSVMSRARLQRNLIAVTILSSIVLLLSELIFAWLIWQDSINILDYIYKIFGIAFTQNHLIFIMITIGILSILIQLFITYSSASVMYRFRLLKMLDNKQITQKTASYLFLSE